MTTPDTSEDASTGRSDERTGLSIATVVSGLVLGFLAALVRPRSWK